MAHDDRMAVPAHLAARFSGLQARLVRELGLGAMDETALWELVLSLGLDAMDAPEGIAAPEEVEQPRLRLVRG